MNVKIQTVKFDADKKLVAFTEEKVAKLGRFSDDLLGAEVIFKLDKDVEMGNKVAVVKLNATGGELIAERQCKTFEESVDQCVDALKKQLEKHKSKK